MIKYLFQVTVGTYPKTQILYEAKTRQEAADWIKENAPGVGATVKPLHIAFLQGGWRRINPSCLSSELEAYAQFEDATLKSN